MDYQIAIASIEDAAEVVSLYSDAYTGSYPDKSFADLKSYREAMEDPGRKIYLAKAQGITIASLVFYYSEVHKLAKAASAVVDPKFQGHGITQELIKYGLEDLKNTTSGVEVVYITTRTVHKAAQVLTANMGFRQLGIFPNVHKTKDYETHALAAMYMPGALENRFSEFEQHPDIFSLFEIVQENIELPSMNRADIWKQKNYNGEVPPLEVVAFAPLLVNRRYQSLKERDEIDLAFFPFHKPNLWITTPEQKIEVFCYVNEVDKHCVILGCKIDREVSFTNLFLTVSNLLRDRGIRYIELILRANRMNVLNKILQAKFIPCGYLPAFQLQDGKRYDYVVFSRSFEILDFNNLELTGENQKYLRNYIGLWEQKFLGGYFKNDN